MYHCGSSDSWSNLYRFKTLPAKKVGPEWTLNLLIFGDLGNGQAKTLSMLQEEVELRRPDLVVQVGDFAYNLEVSCFWKRFLFRFFTKVFSRTTMAAWATPSSATLSRSPRSGRFRCASAITRQLSK